jgi:hypothetical protein
LGAKSWYWGGREEDWNGSRHFDAALEEDAETSFMNEWDMTCHEAVERDMRVAVYDFTPFHDGELMAVLIALAVSVAKRSVAEVVGSMISTLNDTGIQTDVYRESIL